jgi:ADP-ribose pyrophosphatase YjhB (NUDIX family)
LVTFGERLLLCRRALAPGYGLWAPPGGFLENGETPQEGAAREVWEETGVRLVGTPLVFRGLTCLMELNEVYANFSASVSCGRCQPGAEALDAAFFAPDELPWAELAYPTLADDLRQFFHERVAHRSRKQSLGR